MEAGADPQSVVAANAAVTLLLATWSGSRVCRALGPTCCSSPLVSHQTMQFLDQNLTCLCSRCDWALVLAVT
jgi:hypothetical protein